MASDIRFQRWPVSPVMLRPHTASILHFLERLWHSCPEGGCGGCGAFAGAGVGPKGACRACSKLCRVSGSLRPWGCAAETWLSEALLSHM